MMLVGDVVDGAGFAAVILSRPPLFFLLQPKGRMQLDIPMDSPDLFVAAEKRQRQPVEWLFRRSDDEIGARMIVWADVGRVAINDFI